MAGGRRIGATVLCVLSIAGGCCREEIDTRKVALSGDSAAQPGGGAQSDMAPLRVAVAPVISPRQNDVPYRPLLDYVGQQLGRPVNMMRHRVCAELNDQVRHGHVDLAFVCDCALVEGERDFGMQILVAPVVLGQESHQSYIIVPRDSQARSIEDLRGREFAFCDPLSSSGYLYPAYLLRQLGETPHTFFRRYVFTYGHDNTLRDVAERRVDAGAIDSLVYQFMLQEDRGLGEGTKVIQESEPLGNPPVVVHPDMDPALRERLREIFLEMGETEQGRQVLAPLMIDRFRVPDHAEYDPVRRMAEADDCAAADSGDSATGGRKGG